MKLTYFRDISFLQAIKALFNELNVPVNYVSDEPTAAVEILKDTYKENNTFKLIDEVYFVGMVDDAAFEGNKSLAVEKIKSDYDGILVFGVTLHQRDNNLLPTRSQLAEISRAFNREYYYTPVVLVFKYSDNKSQNIAFANTERLQYKQAWREGEKAGKVSLLRDIDINKPHPGHEQIIAQLLINPLKVRTFKELYAQWLEVFNVNILNKEFYNELFTWYLWAVRTVSFPNRVDEDTNNTVYNSENVIRLLTRLIFIWFVKEKGLVPETLFEKSKISETLKAFNPDAEDNSDYYKAILQNLFFATLNTEMPKDGGNRVFIDDKKKNKNTGYTEEYMDHLVLRYKNLFTNPDEGLKLFENIPFLNGGLFECLDRRDPETNEEIRIDGFSSTQSKQPVVPNILFFGQNDDLDLSDEYENSNRYKHCKTRGIINILNDYKFTIEENTPLEQEIALDPELLGKIFENLLASYNPETRTTARKQTGSYYTPREIVNYMVDESLIAYLKTRLNCDDSLNHDFCDSCDDHDEKKEKNQGNHNNQPNYSSDNGDELESKLRRLLAYESEENPFAANDQATRQIINALSECKILDPACGSGAFPMGILHKMVFALGKLDPCNQSWKQTQLEKAQRDKQRAQQFENETLREDSLKSAEDKIAYVEASFGETGHELDYARKLFLIENCIYGVDIQQIAVQISKLRFFISLMVDQRVDNSRPNRNILSLPNLETKFVAANTLIPVDKPQQLMFKDPEVEKTEKELHEIHQKIFFTRNYSDKKKLKNKELQTRHSLRKLYVDKAGYSKEAAEKITRWNPFDPLKAAPFFDPEVMFTIEKDKQGGYFDVVIGNPPYIQLQKIKKVADEISKLNYKTFIRTGDIYLIFYECSNNLLIRDGILAFITNSSWMRTEFGEKLREYFRSNVELLKIIDFSDNEIFETATVLTTIVIFKGKKTTDSFLGARLLKDKNLYNQTFNNYLNNLLNKITIEDTSSWVFYSKEAKIIVDKIYSKGTRLKNWPIEFYIGILNGLNEAFVIDEELKNSLIKQDKKCAKILEPMLRGRDIGWYIPNFNKLWLINSHNGIKQINIERIDIPNDYPVIYNYLKKFESQAKIRHNQGDHWTNHRNCVYNHLFKKHKIIYPTITKDLPFSYDEEGYYSNDKTFIIVGEHLKYLTLFFNSKLFRFVFADKFPELQGNSKELKKNIMEEIPVLEPENEELFIKLFDSIISNRKNKNSEYLKLELKNDLLQFKLYTLTYDECKIVDPQIEKLINREDYEKKSIEQLSEL